MGEGLLSAPGVLAAIAARVGTPTYVYDAAIVRERYRELTRAFGATPHRIFYSVKANGNLAILSLLRSLGAGVDVVSGGELARARRAGFAGADIVFSGVGKTAAELDRALDIEVGLVNVESVAELELLASLAARRGVRASVGIRVNPDVTAHTHPYTRTGEKGMKFGVPLDEVVCAAERAQALASLSLDSVGMHIGSQILDAAHYRAGAERLAGIVRELRAAGVTTLRSIDVGGGLGIRYTTETPLSARAFAEAVQPLAEAAGLPLAIEPGRFLVGLAGVLLTRCLYRKCAGGREFVIVDAGMSDLLRPSLYGAEHDIRVVSDGAGGGGGGGDLPVDIVGPMCETGDFLGHGRVLPDAVPGALLAVLGAGAYGFSMSSTYNARPRPAEVLVDGERWAVVRERETVDDLMRGERTGDDIEWRDAERANSEE